MPEEAQGAPAGDDVIKRTPLDAVISDLIRESYDWTCVRCGKECPDRKGRDFHCSHFYSRAYNSVRYFLDNLLCLCAACHDFVGKNPDEHVALIKRVLGDVRYEELQARKQRIYRYRKQDKAEMLAHYKAQLAYLKHRRAKGERGVLPVVSWD
jgi:hypothetical protein